MPLYHCSPTLLEAGSIILPGNWGRVIAQIGMHHGCWNREMSLEYARNQYFQDKPSRLQATFAMESLETAEYYRQQVFPTSIIYEVEFLEANKPVHKGNFTCVEPIQGRLEKSMLEIAMHYWQSDWWVPLTQYPHIEPVEIVSKSALKVLRQI